MDFQTIFTIFVICEIFELFYTQKGDTISAYIAHLLLVFRQGIVRFLCLHPSFYAAIFAVIYMGVYPLLAVILIAMKALDISLKLVLLSKIEEQKPLGLFGEMIERDIPISFMMKFSVFMFYITIFYIGFGSYT